MNEFFVGYLPEVPPGIARTVRKAILLLLLGAGLLAIVLVKGQRPFPPAAFEFFETRDFEGVIEEHPYPALLVERPGITDREHAYSRYLFVAEGKHGAEDRVTGLSGKRVKLRGKLIYRDHQTLIELVSGSVVPTGDAQAAITTIDLGPVTLSGEVVDSKCYLGVMNPGEGKVHRDCATRCLSGGIPPALVTRDSGGQSTVYLLADANGGPLRPDWVAKRVAQPVTIRGRLVRSGDTLIVNTDASGAASPDVRTARTRHAGSASANHGTS